FQPDSSEMSASKSAGLAPMRAATSASMASLDISVSFSGSLREEIFPAENGISLGDSEFRGDGVRGVLKLFELRFQNRANIAVIVPIINNGHHSRNKEDATGPIVHGFAARFHGIPHHERPKREHIEYAHLLGLDVVFEVRGGQSTIPRT